MEANSVPLTYEERRVIDDSRYSIVRPQVKDWNLLIRDARKEDAGDYLCTINTYPVKTKLVTLYVIGKYALCALLGHMVTLNFVGIFNGHSGPFFSRKNGQYKAHKSNIVVLKTINKFPYTVILDVEGSLAEGCKEPTIVYLFTCLPLPVLI